MHLDMERDSAKTTELRTEKPAMNTTPQSHESSRTEESVARGMQRHSQVTMLPLSVSPRRREILQVLNTIFDSAAASECESTEADPPHHNVPAFPSTESTAALV